MAGVIDSRIVAYAEVGANKIGTDKSACDSPTSKWHIHRSVTCTKGRSTSGDRARWFPLGVFRAPSRTQITPSE